MSWRRRLIHIHCDNMAVVQVMCSGKCKDQSLATMNRNIWLECAINDIKLKVSHIPGKVNVVADMLSRWTGSDCQRTKLMSMISHPTWWTVYKQHLQLDLNI